jgi:hypothetical protein
VRWSLLFVATLACRLGFDDRALSTQDGAVVIADAADDAVACMPVPERPGDGSCSDGVDNDCDGAIDHDDNDCPVMRFRSVGTAGGALATGTLEVAGLYAYLDTALPDQVGVGDAVVYGVTADSIAFISDRVLPTKFRLETAAGQPVPPVSAGTPFTVYRAYTSLQDWSQLAENPALPVAVRNFDTLRDLPAAGAALTVALYADGVDQGNVSVSGWTTSPDHYLRLFTPVRPEHVGRTQRHAGVYGTGYRLEAAANLAALRISQSHLRIEGLSVKSFLNAGPTIAGLEVLATAADIDVRVSHVVADGNGSDSSNGILHMEAIGADASGTFRVSNNIAYGAPLGSSECMWHRNNMGASARFFIFNNTVWDCARGIEARDTAGQAIVINNIAFATSIAFYEFNGPGEFGPASSNNVSNDSSAAAFGSAGITGAVASQLFVSLAGTIDLHLRADAPIRGSGVDLAAHPTLPVLDDIDGQLRPASALDPGADQH